MRKLLLFALLIPLFFIVSCGANTVTQITAAQAKTMMDDDSSIILVDVRTQEEYDEVHIPDALLLPLDQISSKAATVIPDKDATYIIYCRSGNRSADASQQLVSMGYSNVYDMGGIIYWQYETTT